MSRRSCPSHDDSSRCVLEHAVTRKGTEGVLEILFGMADRRRRIWLLHSVSEPLRECRLGFPSTPLPPNGAMLRSTSRIAGDLRSMRTWRVMYVADLLIASSFNRAGQQRDCSERSSRAASIRAKAMLCHQRRPKAIIALSHTALVKVQSIDRCWAAGMRQSKRPSNTWPRKTRMRNSD